MVEPEDNRLFTLYRKLVLWTLLLLAGLILWVLSGDQRNAFIQPGTLTASHAGIKQCEACHSAANLGIKGWVNAALDESTQHDTKLCLNCHELGEFPEFAHSVAPSVVKQISEKILSSDKQQTLLVQSAKRLGWAPQTGAKLECKSCHQEHSGNHQLITANSTDHCQSCHSQSFASFEDGHPEFSQYPFRERTAINFDHVTHINKHFDEQQAPTSCLNCHATRNQGNEMSTLGFEQTCSSCHAEDIRGSKRATTTGFDVLRVPGLDTDTLRERQVFIGEWPDHADESLSPLMELLLQSDAHYATVRPILNTVDLMDLREASDKQLEAVATLAWCVKMLLQDIINGGTGFLQMRLEKALGRPLSHAQIAPLLATLPQSVIQSASTEWFPTLSTDLEHHFDGKEYWKAAPEPAQTAVFSKAATENSLEDKLDLNDDDLFADDDSDDLWETDDDAEPEADTPTAQLAITSEQWAKYGGWYRDDLTLYYRPVGHADGFLRHWLELSANVGNATALFKQLSDPKAPGQCMQCHSIDQAANTTGDDSALNSSIRTINWLTHSSARDLSFGKRKFTHFRHIPHLTLQGDDGCQSCHALNADSDYAGSFDNFDASTFSSNFSHMEKTSCDSCHNRSVENQDCLSCHQYHAGELSPAIKSLGL
ncbi:MAG: hypothetical protein AB8B48_06555 [Pseudomonadales bacterium]